MSFLDEVTVNRKTIVFVSGLSDEITSQVLESYFIPFGPIVSVKIPIDEKTNRIRGHAFIEFEAPEDAADAVENMHDAELFNNVLKCNIADPNASKPKAVWDSMATSTAISLQPQHQQPSSD